MKEKQPIKQVNEKVDQTLLEIIEEHKEHLEKNEVIVCLNDGYCEISYNSTSEKYQILADAFDIKINLSLESFIKK